MDTVVNEGDEVEECPTVQGGVVGAVEVVAGWGHVPSRTEINLDQVSQGRSTPGTLQTRHLGIKWVSREIPFSWIYQNVFFLTQTLPRIMVHLIRGLVNKSWQMYSKNICNNLFNICMGSVCNFPVAVSWISTARLYFNAPLLCFLFLGLPYFFFAIGKSERRNSCLLHKTKYAEQKS